jgi:hypothetical protein
LELKEAKDMRRKSERESDITLKLECVKLAQRALPEAFSEVMFAFAQEIHAWILADDGRPARRPIGSKQAKTSWLSSRPSASRARSRGSHRSAREPGPMSRRACGEMGPGSAHQVGHGRLGHLKDADLG